MNGRSEELCIGVLLCDGLPDEYLPIAGDYMAMFSLMFRERDVALVPFETYNGRLPDGPRECDGYVISGSRVSVYHDEQWIRDLETFIRDSVRDSVPIFGVCFGLQVMATALGGTVQKSRRGWGVGVHTMTVGEERSWMEPAVDTVSLIMSHQDQVTCLPERATVVGSSDHCEKFLVEFTPIHVGIQGHPEFRAPFAEAIYSDRPKELGELAAGAVASLETPTDAARMADWAMAIFRSPKSEVRSPKSEVREAGSQYRNIGFPMTCLIFGR